jgi:osmotically-inducible protein OsmY
MSAHDPAPPPSQGDSEPKHGALGHLSAEEEVQQSVCSALIEATELDSRNLGVRMSSGTVILSGSVRSREAWLLAVRVARSQPGVSAVETDQLRIDG